MRQLRIRTQLSAKIRTDFREAAKIRTDFREASVIYAGADVMKAGKSG
jgi:hypothetical protein